MIMVQTSSPPEFHMFSFRKQNSSAVFAAVLGVKVLVNLPVKQRVLTAGLTRFYTETQHTVEQTSCICHFSPFRFTASG